MKRRIQNLNQPLGRKGARRRVRTRTALLLFLTAMAGTVLMGLLGGFVPEGVRVWLGAIASVAFFALPAYLGLCEIDGDQTRLLSLRRLSGAQVLWLAASGALLICPATLMNDVMAALAARFAAAFGMQAAAAAAQSAGSASLLLPMLLASGILAPVCEEVFFRGYLQGAFARYGAVQASIVTALLFAAVHGLGAGLLVYALLGLVFSAFVLRMGSVLASVMLHTAYNMTLIVLSALPLSALFTGLTPVGCLVRLLGCAVLGYTAKRAWLARGAREGKPEALSVSKKEMLLAIAVLLLVLLAQVTAVLAAGGNA